MAARRARSQDLLTETFRNGPHCQACWTQNPGHRAHIYRGDCIGLSGQRIWTPVPPRRNTPAGQGGSSSDPVSGQRRLLPLPTVGVQSRLDAAGLAVPDSQESLFTSLPSVAGDPRGFRGPLDGVSALEQEEEPPSRGRSGRPADAGLGPQTMSGNSLEVALGVPSASRGLLDVALVSQTMSSAPTSNLVVTRSVDQPPDERARAGEAPQVGLEGRVGLLESQMMVILRELRASREEMQNLTQAIQTSQEAFQRAATRIEMLEFEWTVWNTEDGQAPSARDPPPGLLGASGAGLITQQLEDLMGFGSPNQGQSPADGPTEFQLTPNCTPRSGDGEVNAVILPGGTIFDPVNFHIFIMVCDIIIDAHTCII